MLDGIHECCEMAGRLERDSLQSDRSQHDASRRGARP
jgi:hypothetical protein